MTRYKLSWIVCVVLASYHSNVNTFISSRNSDISPYCGPTTGKFGTRASGIFRYPNSEKCRSLSTCLLHSFKLAQLKTTRYTCNPCGFRITENSRWRVSPSAQEGAKAHSPTKSTIHIILEHRILTEERFTKFTNCKIIPPSNSFRSP